MKLAFRQGLVKSQPNFLSKVGTTVSFSTSNSAIVLTFSHGTEEYLFTEPVKANETNAWLNVPTATCWLYWDLNIRTAERTFGYTVRPPVNGPITPAQLIDQHWFDTVHNKMKVWNGLAWVEKLRVFAPRLVNGLTWDPIVYGSQVGLNTSYESGRIIFDGSGNPLIKENGGFFTTESKWFVDNSLVGTSKLEQDVIQLTASENIPKFSVIKFLDFEQAGLASYEDTDSYVLGIVTNDALFGEQLYVVIQGRVENLDWNWERANMKLWVDENGELTSIDPHSSNPTRELQVPIAKTISPTAIMFMQGLGAVGPIGPTGLVKVDVDLASPSIGGITKLSVPAVDSSNPIAVGNNDIRLYDSRNPLPHNHQAASISTIPYNNLTGVNVQTNLQELYNQKINNTGGTFTGPVYFSRSPLTNLEAATKQYVDSMVTSIRWVDPINYVNLISDSVSTPPPTPNYGDVYILPISGTTGLWSSLGGHLVRWNNLSWEDLGVWNGNLNTQEIRFGLALSSSTGPSGTFIGRKNQIATWSPIYQSWRFTVPIGGDALYILAGSLHSNQQMVYDTTHTKWVIFGGAQSLVPGRLLNITGNILSVTDGSSSGLVAEYLGPYSVSDFSLSNHTHTSFLPYEGGTLTGTLVLDATTSLTCNGLSSFNDNMFVNGNISITSGTITVSRDPVSAYEVATKQYVDGNLSLPYDLTYFISGTINLADSILGSIVCARIISIDPNFPNSIARSHTTPTSELTLSIRKNNIEIGQIIFSSGSQLGTFVNVIGTDPIELSVGDFIDIVAPSTLNTGSAASDIVITLVGCSTTAKC